MASKRIKKYKRTKFFLQALSWILCFGMCAAYIIIGFIRADKGEVSEKPEVNNIAKQLKTVATSAVVIFIPMIVLSIIAGHKFKPTVWMIDIILSNILCGNVMMYITFAVWIFDTYILTPLIEKYKTKIIVRKELALGE